jgi:hypothetical protein
MQSRVKTHKALLEIVEHAMQLDMPKLLAWSATLRGLTSSSTTASGSVSPARSHIVWQWVSQLRPQRCWQSWTMSPRVTAAAIAGASTALHPRPGRRMIQPEAARLHSISQKDHWSWPRQCATPEGATAALAA